MSLKAAKYTVSLSQVLPLWLVLLHPGDQSNQPPIFNDTALCNAMQFFFFFNMIICTIQSKHIMHNLKSMNYSGTIKIILLVTVVLGVFMKSGSTLRAAQEAIRPIQRQSSEIIEKAAFFSLHNQ